MNTYVLIGGYDGSFLKPILDQYDQFHVFEPLDIPPAITSEKVIFLRCAAGVKDGTCRIYVGRRVDGTFTQGSSQFKDKTSGGLTGESLSVPCLDIRRYLNNLLRCGNRVTVRMNCEGAEYLLLPHISDIVHKLERLDVKWHADKIPSIPKEIQQTCLSIAAETPAYATV